VGLSPDIEKRANQLANLRPWEKNKSPRGTTKRKGTIDLKRRLRNALLEYEVDKHGNHRQVVDMFIRNEIVRALQGDRDCANIIWRLFEEDARDGGGLKLIVEHVIRGTPYHPPGPALEPGEDSGGAQEIYSGSLWPEVREDPPGD